jgi:uncharacterized membrane protein
MAIRRHIHHLAFAGAVAILLANNAPAAPQSAEKEKQQPTIFPSAAKTDGLSNSQPMGNG